MKRELRLQSFRSKTEFTGYQLLQERRFFGWKTIDSEEIPMHVIISLATYGDSGGWRSKFAHLPVWGRLLGCGKAGRV